MGRNVTRISTSGTLLFSSLLLLFLQKAHLGAAILDFEGLADGELITSQFPGLTFSNSVALQAGVGLNEFEFPPVSGNTVISDDGGLISIMFATPVTSVSAYFTYLVPLTLRAFDKSG